MELLDPSGLERHGKIPGSRSTGMHCYVHPFIHLSVNKTELHPSLMVVSTDFHWRTIIVCSIPTALLGSWVFL